jgi:hypothetical protein
MPHTDTLLQAPPAVQFCAELKAKESAIERHVVAAGDLELSADGSIEVHTTTLTGAFSVAPVAQADVARTADIPPQYFIDCDPELRSPAHAGSSERCSATSSRLPTATFSPIAQNGRVRSWSRSRPNSLSLRAAGTSNNLPSPRRRRHCRWLSTDKCLRTESGEDGRYEGL